jgi:hypothetical protein
MKFVSVAIGALMPAILFAADIRPDSSGILIFQVFELTKTGPDIYDFGPTGQPTHHSENG